MSDNVEISLGVSDDGVIYLDTMNLDLSGKGQGLKSFVGQEKNILGTPVSKVAEVTASGAKTWTEFFNVPDLWFPEITEGSTSYPEVNRYLVLEPSLSHEEITLLGELHVLLDSIDVKEDVKFGGRMVGQMVRMYSTMYHDHADQLNNRDWLNLTALGFKGIVPGEERNYSNRDIRLFQKLVAHSTEVRKSVVENHPIYLQDTIGENE